MILVGIPLSGKSTFIQNQLKGLDINIISRDEILMEVYGSRHYNDAYKNVDQKKVDKLLMDRIKTYSSEGRNVVIDMTNLTSKRRKYNLSFFDDRYQKIAIVFTPPSLIELQNRNKKRQTEENKNIPESVLSNMLRSMQPIKEEEGFDKIINI